MKPLTEVVHTYGVDRFRMKPALQHAAGLPPDVYVDIEAMHLCSGTDRATSLGGLDANSAALARITGWMVSHGFHDFRIVGAQRPYGLEIATRDGGITIDPDGWVMLNAVGFYGASAEGFAQIFDPA